LAKIQAEAEPSLSGTPNDSVAVRARGILRGPRRVTTGIFVGSALGMWLTTTTTTTTVAVPAGAARRGLFRLFQLFCCFSIKN